MKKKKLNQLWYDLSKILVSFLLISLIGGYLGHFWQNREYKNQALIEQKKYEKESATRLFEEVSKQLDRQVSNFQFLVNDEFFRNKCKEDFLIWNENKTRLRALTEKYFGASASASLAHFADILKKLYVNNFNGTELLEVTPNTLTEINNLEIEIKNFNLQLVDDLLRENIGSSREKLKNSFETELKP